MCKKNRLLNISRHAERCTQEADILCCSFTGCGTTSYFKCLGMVKPLKEMQSIPCFIPVLGRLGASREMPDNLMDELEAFRRALYGNPRTTSKNELHYMKLTQLYDNTVSTPEASISIQTYLLATDDWSNRSNVYYRYVVAIWKCDHIAEPDIPSSFNANGWKTRIGPFSRCSLRGMFYQESRLVFCNKLYHMSGLMREVVRSQMEQSTIVN